MSKSTLLAAIALLGLAACNRISVGQGGNDSANGSAAANATAANSAGNVAVADAGITSSRSLAGLTGGSQSSGDGGGKDPPGAVEARSSEGVIDPRLVGSWSDNGTCKDAAQLRADGTFQAQNGASGRWSLEGNQLVFRGGNGEFRLQVDSIQPDRIVTTTAQGQTGASIRC